MIPKTPSLPQRVQMLLDLTYGTFMVNLPVKAVSKGRPRFSRGRAYTPAKTQQFEDYVADSCRTLMGDRELLGRPLEVTIKMMEVLPKSKSPHFKAAANMGLVHPARGDVDNKAKSILDGMNGVVYWDDNQVCALQVYTEYGPENMIEVRVRERGLCATDLKAIAKVYLASVFDRKGGGL